MPDRAAVPCPVDPDGHARRVLEFSKVLELAASEARSAGGKARLLARVPAAEAERVRVEQELVQEARAGLDAGIGPWPLEGAHDVRPLLRQAELPGASLEAADLRRIADTLDVGRRLRRYLSSHAESLPRACERAAGLHDHHDLVAAVHKVVNERGELVENASPLLVAIRRQIGEERQALLERLEALQRAADASPDQYVTLRGERYVIPVRTEAARAVRGIVHDRSASGATLFVEPLEVVDANNDLQRLRDAERREIERLLRELTRAVAAEAETARATQDALEELDDLHARAQLSQRLRAASPHPGKALCLRDARHPLLDLQLQATGGAAVPVDVDLQGARVLLITGPNTGGKTVALKTVGLLALMHQAGLQVPAHPDSELPVFEHIVADIGDEQSIESSESTFSSHLRHVCRALRDAGSRSLVLLDELMADTDPDEGAALAKVVLRRLAAAGGATLVTTHLGALKLFAHAEPGLANAGMTFDPRSRRPLYRLQPGIPGSSNALAIAARIGLDPELLRAAEAERGTLAGELEGALSGLEEERARLAEAREGAEAAVAEARRMREEHARLLAELTARRRTSQAEARREVGQLVAAARARIESVVRELREAAASRDSIQAAHQALAGLEAGVEERPAGEEPRAPEPGPREGPVELRPGDRVWVPALLREGILEELSPDGRARVLLGNAPVSVRASDLQPAVGSRETASPEAERPSPAPPAGGFTVPESEPIPARLDVRGLERAEALQAVDRFLDHMLMQGSRQAEIVHGKGTGVLRRSIQEHLAGHPDVVGFRLGGHGEGGSGVTIVEMR